MRGRERDGKRGLKNGSARVGRVLETEQLEGELVKGGRGIRRVCFLGQA